MRITWKNVIFILIIVILSTGATVAINMFYLKTEYQSSVSLITIGNIDASNSANSLFSSLEIGLNVKNDYMNITKTSDVLSLARKNIIADIPEYNEYSIGYISNNTKVEPVPDSRIFKIIYTDTDPYRAQVVANRLGEALISKIQSFIKVNTLQILDPANFPETKSGPQTLKNSAIAALFSLCGSVIIVLLFNYFRSGKSQSRVNKNI